MRLTIDCENAMLVTDCPMSPAPTLQPSGPSARRSRSSNQVRTRVYVGSIESSHVEASTIAS